MMLELNSSMEACKRIKLSEYQHIITTKVWQDKEKNSVTQARYETLLKTLADVSNSITKTFANAITQLAKSR